ncbi:hypothetical protein SDC9_130921 [bioreactor metagenome]|uniref:Uncharacterized protein n=1 Tax=bioreactor metagenome TaxID=1076179 RepID=A0A645D5E5_9ZZZZ
MIAAAAAHVDHRLGDDIHLGVGDGLGHLVGDLLNDPVLCAAVGLNLGVDGLCLGKTHRRFHGSLGVTLHLHLFGVGLGEGDDLVGFLLGLAGQRRAACGPVLGIDRAVKPLVERKPDVAEHGHHHHAQHAHHDPGQRHGKLRARFGGHAVHGTDESHARGEHQQHQDQHHREEPPEHVAHEFDAHGGVQFLHGGTQKEVGEEHAAHPDDDGYQMDELESDEKHGAALCVGNVGADGVALRRDHSSSDALQRSPQPVRALSISRRSRLVGRPSVSVAEGSGASRRRSAASARAFWLASVSE